MSELPWSRYAMDEQTGEIYDARTWSRRAARRRFRREHGHYGKFIVAFRYARFMTLPEIWEARDRTEQWKGRLEDELYEMGEPPDRLEELLKGRPVPSSPPANWEPDEFDPAWEFCNAAAPDAAPVWFCEEAAASTEGQGCPVETEGSEAVAENTPT